jgi:hypothetical protein
MNQIEEKNKKEELSEIGKLHNEINELKKLQEEILSKINN